MKTDPAGHRTISLSRLTDDETVENHGCSTVVRHVDGPEATEIFLHCAPLAVAADAAEQAEAIYRAILDVLAARGGTFQAVFSETVFLRNLRACIEPIREARRRVLAEDGIATHRPPATEIEQPPLNQHAR